MKTWPKTATIFVLNCDANRYEPRTVRVRKNDFARHAPQLAQVLSSEPDYVPFGHEKPVTDEGSALALVAGWLWQEGRR